MQYSLSRYRSIMNTISIINMSLCTHVPCLTHPLSAPQTLSDVSFGCTQCGQSLTHCLFIDYTTKNGHLPLAIVMQIDGAMRIQLPPIKRELLSCHCLDTCLMFFYYLPNLYPLVPLSKAHDVNAGWQQWHTPSSASCALHPKPSQLI